MKKALAGIILFGALLSGCTNSAVRKAINAASSNTGANGAANIVMSSATYNIAGVTVDSAATSGSTGLGLTVNMDQTSSSAPSLLDVCTNSQGSMPCLCKFSWNQINSTSGAPITIPHQVYTAVTAVQKALAVCSTPPTWQTDIPDNTSISISIVPGQGNPAQFSNSTYAFTKGQNTETGNFKDNMGRSFVNILRYACYEERQRGMSIVNKVGSQTVSGIGTFGYVGASQFCLTTASGQIKGDSGCSALAPVDYTAQSYYYNMYIRDSESGDINGGNASFVCPSVTEALNQQRDGSGNLIVGTQGKYWPLDTSFALSLGKTSDYSVGVVAHSKTTSTNDPTAQNTSCDGTTTAPASANSLISSCLGFAAPSNIDGTCPKVGGVTTYRLRRYVAIYPSIYDTTGQKLNESQRLDTIYVLDRPVLDANGNIQTDSKGNPYSMLGPKPCPFSYYDSHNVTGAGTHYYGTNNSLWNGKNVDDIHFPYQDTGSAASGTCAAALPVVNPANSKVSISTLTSKLYVRPSQSWSPHYEEDVGFQACAPQSSPLRDPPLHFAMNGTNMAWCAEVYPTQNDNYAKLAAGSKNYTSHKVKNSTGGGSCPLSSTSTSVAGHSGADSTTCDRTVVNPIDGIGWSKFPLLASDAEVTAALQSDASFGCAMTYDAGSGKVNSSDFSLGKSPSQGCCSNVSPPAGAGNSAHLEPVAMPNPIPSPFPVSCATPRY